MRGKKPQTVAKTTFEHLWKSADSVSCCHEFKATYIIIIDLPWTSYSDTVVMEEPSPEISCISLHNWIKLLVWKLNVVDMFCLPVDCISNMDCKIAEGE
jgi:hypothetical protein